MAIVSHSEKEQIVAVEAAPPARCRNTSRSERLRRDPPPDARYFQVELAHDQMGLFCHPVIALVALQGTQRSSLKLKTHSCRHAALGEF
jgi:hypothetical protein